MIFIEGYVILRVVITKQIELGSRTKLSIGLQTDPHAYALGCGFARLINDSHPPFEKDASKRYDM